MSIDLYSGTPGSGKSLYACYEIIRLLKMGRGVISNFPIDLKYFKRRKIGKFTFVDNENLTVDFLFEYAKNNHKPYKESQTTIFIDEASTMFNSREWDKKDRSKWVKFFQQHRKLGFNVVLICQQDRMLDRQIRAFIESEFKHRALKNYKTFGFLLSIFLGGAFFRVEYWYPVKLKCQASMFLYNDRKAKIYDTYQIFE